MNKADLISAVAAEPLEQSRRKKKQLKLSFQL